MTVKRDKIGGVYKIIPAIHSDHRGFFAEVYKRDIFDLELEIPEFVQDNLSHSQVGVLRGLHIQRNNPQGKYVTCVHGSVFDVWVDLRRDSPTAKQWSSTVLSRGQSVYIPPGCAHGFFTMSNFATVHYKCTTEYDRESDGGIIWNDEELGIEWPFDATLSPMLSDKDKQLPSMAKYLEGSESTHG